MEGCYFKLKNLNLNHSLYKSNHSNIKINSISILLFICSNFFISFIFYFSFTFHKHLLCLRHLNSWLLWIIPLVGGQQSSQHLQTENRYHDIAPAALMSGDLDGPEEDAGQEQGDEETHPDRQREQGVTVPWGAEPGHDNIVMTLVLETRV